MRVRRRDPRLIPLVLAAGSFALAFVQRPGWATADTKVNLHLAPGPFLAEVARMWTATGQLGGVQAAQQTGYLFPMGPFFAAGHALGLSPWVVQRLWLGALLSLAVWGVVRLLDALRGPPRGVAALLAGAVTILNPFVVVYANRTTVTLLAYAALPWLLVVVHRGVREPRGWRWPALGAALVAASGGGVNGAVTAWMLIGPLLLLAYELAFCGVPGAAARRFLMRALPLTVLASLWWVIPAWVQAGYGTNFLQFTEQPGTVWGTTSATESLRLMSFWLSYVGIGFAGRAIPYFDDAPALLFSAPVVLASLLLPAGALGSYIAARRWRYGPFFLLLALIGVVVMMAGFPDGTPLRHGLTFTYNRVAAVRFLRASYKAAPLVAISYAVLAGVGAEALWRWARIRGRGRVPQVILARAGLAVAIALVLALASWPLVTGRAQDRQVSYRRIPAAWRAAARDIDRSLPAGARALELPGELFAFYTWGGTVDPILPVLSRRPVAVRTQVPYGDPRVTDLLWTIDGLVHQGRLLPSQLAPLTALIGVRAVVTGSDDDPARSDAPAPADVAAELAAQPGFARPARSYGPAARFATSAPAPAVALPEVRRYVLAAARPRVRIESGPPVVIDGSAGALAGLAAFGSLPAAAPLAYSADLAPGALRAALAGGGRLVLSDSNRRSAFASGTLEQNAGPTLSPAENVSADGLILDPFGRGPDAETVASYGGGIVLVHAPSSPQRPQFPEHAPFAALDGSPATAWLADPTLDPSRRWLEVDFPRSRVVRWLRLLPYGDAGGTPTAVAVNGRSFVLRPGWNRLTLGQRAVTAVRVAITTVSAAAPGAIPGAGGIRELQIPGVHATESLRLPLDAPRALPSSALNRAELDILLDRTTGDQPFRRDLAHGPWSAADVRQPGDAEQTIDRTVALPAARRFTAAAWVNVLSSAPDPVLDRLAGGRAGVLATSSSRFDGEPRWRASAALDGDRATAWIGDWRPGHPAWVAWRTPGPVRLRRLRLVAPALPVARPTRVRLSWPGGAAGPLAVSAGGAVVLPRPVSARAFTLTVLAARIPLGASDAERRAVGIAEIAGAPRAATAPGRAFSAPCGTVTLTAAGRRIPLRVGGARASFGDGDPLPARACGRPVGLPRGIVRIRSLPGPLAVDAVMLSSPAPRPLIPRAAPRWLVLGEGYNRGWRASCAGRGLGSPVPIDGYANGWRLSAACPRPTFAFAPQRVADVGYLVSGVAGVVCLLVLAFGLRLRRRRSAVPEPLPVAAPPRRWPLRSAVPAAIAPAAAFGFVFGLRAGAVAVAVIAVVLWRGVGSGALTGAAAALLGVVVPLLYLVRPASPHGGNHYGYAVDHMAASWVGVAAIGLLTLALWRSLLALRRARAAARPAAPRRA